MGVQPLSEELILTFVGDACISVLQTTVDVSPRSYAILKVNWLLLLTDESPGGWLDSPPVITLLMRFASLNSRPIRQFSSL